MRTSRYAVVLLLGLGAPFTPAWSEEEVPEPPETPEVGEPDPDADGDEAGDRPDAAKDAARIHQLATDFGVADQQVQDMRQTRDMGWGEIENLLLIAQAVSDNSAATATPLTMDEALQQVLAERASGMGLGAIAKSHGVKLGDLKKPDHAKGNKPDVPGKPDKPADVEKPDRPDKPVKPDKPQKPDKPDKPEKPAKPDHPGHGQ